MKRDMENLNLRNALPGEPEACRQSLILSARSVKEEEPVRKLTFRVVLLTVLIVAAMMTAALAAGGSGLAAWYQSYYNALLPKTAQDILSEENSFVMQAGPVKVTADGFLCDGKILYMTADAQLQPEHPALLYPSSDDWNGRIGEVWAQMLGHPDIHAETTYLEAARVTGLPLYCVSTWIEPLVDVPQGEAMGDGQMQTDGTLMTVIMRYFHEVYEEDTLPVKISIDVWEVDLDTLEAAPDSAWHEERDVSVAVHGVTEEKRYVPDETACLSERFRLDEVTAKKTAAGVYVTIRVKPDGGMTYEDMMHMNFEWDVLNEKGVRFPTGLSLTREYLDGQGKKLDGNTSAHMLLEEMQYMLMITADELPQTMMITDGQVRITVR